MIKQFLARVALHCVHSTVIIFLTIVLAISASPFFNIGAVQAASNPNDSFTLYADSNGWNYSRPPWATNPAITVNAGDSVSITLIGLDEHPHLFVLDLDGNGPSPDCPGPDKCAGVISPGENLTLSFIADFAGSYKYYDYYYPATTVGYFFVQAPDFVINTDSGTFAFANGSSTSMAIEVSSYGRFDGTVNLSAVANPPGVSATIAPSSLALKGQQSLFPILTVAGSIPGTFAVTLTATNGTSSRTGVFTVIVTDGPDFIITSTPSSQTALAGVDDSSSTGIRLESTGFTGTVVMSANVFPLGPRSALSTISLLLGEAGWNYTHLVFYSEAATPADYTVNITGTGGGRTHFILVPFRLSDFAISVSPSSLGPLRVGDSTTSTLTLERLNGFSEIVNFSAIPSSGLSAKLSQTSLGTAGTLTLNVTLTSACPDPCSVTIQAWAPGLTHVITMRITTSLSNGLTAYIIPSAVVGIVAIASGAAYYFRRKSIKRTSLTAPERSTGHAP